jgi:hypothetical protein
MKNIKYKSPKISAIIKSVCENNNLDFRKVLGELQRTFPELWVKERCANCNASMQMYNYKVDVASLMLLNSMAKIFRSKMVGGKNFTEANKIHLTSEIESYTLISHQTITSKLGLIAKVRKADGKHDQKAGWLITRRGFDCLRGEKVPESVVVFRNKIEERSNSFVTMSEVFANYKKGEWKEDINGYSSSSWYSVADHFPNNFVITDEVEE